MSKTAQIDEMVRAQTMDVVRRAQDAAVKVVTAWTENASSIPGLVKFTEQWPTVIDSGFDFAQQLLDSQREFAGRLVAVTAREADARSKKTTPRKAAAPKAVTAKPVAAKATKRPARKVTAK
ncbi:hypothetical protein [Mycolicibacterium holsaticum]|uniref:hypothetical protein n=1 Tax=Mycolicibacterium holsaticum TaxID=152142 RepID=UPI001C7DE07B|nr:hypothetical protein [Mycolicibacterium holsaticum]MDA4107103.1 hypothetical protein [Mycolicibacterium holsaticum DSM 44478 = JCM 12374]QZA11315.1 hypothetical protein K3U96_19075 [Mycolicibacterium holsaticum DSM 44478 = JCM 12374]UNC11194.1 hypothetical protein H5U41_07750 [Mycolicibacterium holsaticum DSM 44478 = JCM 12374]